MRSVVGLVNVHNIMEATCDYCGETFERAQSSLDRRDNVFCSRDCSGKYRRSGEVVVCEVCGKEEYRIPQNVNEEGNHFCSNECQAKFNYDRVEVHCDNCSNTIRKWPSVVTDTNFCSVSCKAEYQEEMLVGENNPNWGGGVDNPRNTEEWKKFSQKKKKEADWKCEYCESSSDILNTHHVYPLEIGGDMWDNEFIVLCFTCHRGDYAYWHPPQLAEYID